LLASQTISGSGLSGLSFTLRNGDINGDNKVDLADFSLLRTGFGTSSTGPADLNGDGLVNLADFSILRSNFGQSGAP